MCFSKIILNEGYLFSQIANGLRDNLETTDSKKIRKKEKMVLNFVKLAAVVAAVSAITLAVSTLSLLSALQAAATLLLSYDAYRVADNRIIMKYDVFTNVTANLSEQSSRDMASRNTILAGYVVDFFDIDFRDV